jgi:RNA polymerase sigma factor (sigma-70 family)
MTERDLGREAGGASDRAPDRAPAAVSPLGVPPEPPSGVLAETLAPRPFDRFYLETYQGMVRLARVLVDSPQTAEDLVQDAFVRMHRHWGAVRDPEPYLRRCVVNACRSHHRRLGRERRHMALPVAPGGVRPGLDGRPGENAAGMVATAPGPEERSDDADLLAGAIGALPYRQRAAVVLRYYADLPDAEIATALGCRIGTVGSLVHRALQRLREEVHHDE